MPNFESEALIECTVITAPSGDVNNPPATAGNYEAVRYNAMKHGVLSKLAVLAHENHAEFDELLAALIDEHRPAGVTEQCLIEELASIIWRKRRVLLGENAQINHGLKSTMSQIGSVLNASTPFQEGLSAEKTNLRDLFKKSPDELTALQNHAILQQTIIRKACAILRDGGATAYKRARRSLNWDVIEAWDDLVATGNYQATIEDLLKFLNDILRPIYVHQQQEAAMAHVIKLQTLGDGMQVQRLEKLNRYETHLDRKFERTLAMLLKLKSLRSS